MNGLDSLPRYSYDPRTQTYRLMTPQEKAVAAQQGPLDYTSGGGDGTASSGTSSGTGSGGVVGDIGLGLMGLGQAVPGVTGMVANVAGQALADMAIDAQANANAALAQANEQAQEATVSQGLMGPTVSTTTSISPVAPPAPVSISSIAPTDALAAMNAAPPSTSVASSPAATAAAVADSIAAVADAMGIGPGVGPGESAPGTDGGGGGGADGGAGTAGDAGAGVGGSADSSGDGTGGERAGGIIAMRHRYAQGGMPDVARHVQSQGRGDDKVLVHMTPKEVQGLQYLAMRHGGSLTINPRTGLVEAGFLSSILPMVAGAALTIGSGGAINPYMSAAIVGGVTGLASGSLSKGLMAGLGAFGGAGLGTGLAAAGATAPAVTGTQAGLTGAGEVAAANVAAPAFEYAPVGFNTGAAGATTGLPGLSAADAARMFGTGAPGAETFAGIAPPPTTAADIAARADVLGIAPGTGPMYAPPPAPPTFGQNLQQAGRGFSNIFDFQNQAGTDARQAFLGSAATKTAPATGVGGMSGLLRYGGAAAAPMIAASMGPDQSAGTGGKGQAFIRPFKYEPGRQDVAYRTGAPGESTSEQLYFSPRYTPMGVFRPGEEPTYGSYSAGGGVRERVNRSELDEDLYDFADFRKKRAMQEAGSRVLAAGGGINMGGRIDPDYNENVDRNAAFSDDFYGGGLTALAAGGKPKEPRFLMGKGDGMSDSIPATINDVQPARLADGEFVIPADVVSHLGNGSSKAGAAKLHSMMKRIRQARTGKKRQAPEVKAERYMPA